MTYCMADIHGELDRFKNMLDKISFSDGDRLYIIGDVIDRGACGVDILQMVMKMPNATMLLGNHEEMCLATLGPNNQYGARDLWKQNGGSCTYRELVYHRSVHEKNEILRFLGALPDCLNIVVNDVQYHLVHGYPANNHNDRIWGRPTESVSRPLMDTIAIVGHTPTPHITGNFNEPFHIWYGDGIIDIDCGCGNKTEHRRLACLRLDDMREFYV